MMENHKKKKEEESTREAEVLEDGYLVFNQ